MSLISSLGSDISNLFGGSTTGAGQITNNLANLVTQGLQVAEPFVNAKTAQAFATATGTNDQQTALQLAQIQANAQVAAAQAQSQSSLFGVSGSNELLLLAGIGFAAILVLTIIAHK